jgi:hypothetical protein
MRQNKRGGFMTNEEILREIKALPLEAQQQIEDFVVFLRQRYKSSSPVKAAPASDLKSESFVGMWRDREELQDSAGWVRNVREKHWGG